MSDKTGSVSTWWISIHKIGPPYKCLLSLNSLFVLQYSRCYKGIQQSWCISDVWSPKLNEKSVDFTNQKSTILFRNRYQIPPPPPLWPFAIYHWFFSWIGFTFLSIQPVLRGWLSKYKRIWPLLYRNLSLLNILFSCSLC